MLMYCLLIFELCIADLVSYTFFPGDLEILQCLLKRYSSYYEY